MRKLLALVAVLAIGQAATAQGSMSSSGELRLRGWSHNIADGVEANGAATNNWQQRFKLGLDFNAGEKISAHADLIHAHMWGQTVTGGACGASNCDPTGDSAKAILDGTGTAENLLLVNQMYGTWTISDSTSLRFGRGSFDLADGSVIATNNWETIPYAFDGLMLTHDMEFGRVSAFYVKFADWENSVNGVNASAGAKDAETNSYGLSLDVKSVPDLIKMLNFHVIQVNKDELNAANASTTAAPGESSMRFGLTVAGETSGVDFKLTYASLSGENRTEWSTGSAAANTDISSSMMDVMVGYSMPDMMNFKVGFTYHSDTGQDSSTDDTMYDSFYYDKHNNGGQMDVFYWGNLTYMQIGFSLMPMDDLTVGFDFITFSQTEKTGTNNFGTFTGTSTDAGTEDALGTEMDLWATKKYEGGFEITGRYGTFSPGDEFKGGSEDTYTQMMLEAKMMF